jgi:hypothetical protein
VRRALSTAALTLSFGLLAVPAGAGVGYEVDIEAPAGAVGGTVVVLARAAGGVGEAEHAAYHVRPQGPWVEGESVALDRAGEGRFESRTSPWDTAALPNGRYRVEVRIWGDVPPYDPAQPRTFARGVATVAVDNPPPSPAGLVSSSGSPSVRLGWDEVLTADRGDFLGYRVFRKRGSSCSGTVAYTAVADVVDPFYASGDTPEGAYCYRVAAVRSSPVSGVILSPWSTAVRLEVVAFGAVAGVPGFVTGPGDAVPPPPPVLGEGDLEVSDGGYREDLPYGSRTVTEALEQRPGTGEEAGPDPGHHPFFIGGGLVLAGGGVILLRKLMTAPLP